MEDNGRKKTRKTKWTPFLLPAAALALFLCVPLLCRDDGNAEPEKKDQGSEEISMEPEALQDLSGCPAGTVLRAEQIDQNDLSRYFTEEPVGSEVAERITGKSYRENPDISLEELSYLTVLHYNFDHEIQVGELLVNRRIARDCLEIFTELFRQGYEIHSMYLVDRYYSSAGADAAEKADTDSINDNNTSAFHYRTVIGGSALSNHALGMAIDVNPLQNPYVLQTMSASDSPYLDFEIYADRSRDKAHMIDHDDLCYRLFTEHGFDWGGDWNGTKDYQHFEKE